MTKWLYLFAFIGVVALFAAAFTVAMISIDRIKDAVDCAKRKYEYKHRFDKPPTAACYCIDCKYHNNETGECYRFEKCNLKCTADNWFCWCAIPRAKEDK